VEANRVSAINDNDKQPYTAPHALKLRWTFSALPRPSPVAGRRRIEIYNDSWLSLGVTGEDYFRHVV